jgi:hypothetical protein
MSPLFFKIKNVYRVHFHFRLSEGLLITKIQVVLYKIRTGGYWSTISVKAWQAVSPLLYRTWYHAFSRLLWAFSQEHLSILHTKCTIFPIAIYGGQLLYVVRFTLYCHYQDRESAVWQIYCHALIFDIRQLLISWFPWRLECVIDRCVSYFLYYIAFVNPSILQLL